MFPHAKVTYLQSTYSDHIPILINLSRLNQMCRKRKIPRRFEEKWVRQPGCEEVICASWESEIGGGSPMYCLFEKIKKCRQALVTWSSTTFGNFKTKIQEKQEALEELSLKNDPDNQPLIKTLKNDVNTLLHQDEICWCQRSRSIWLPAGDKNAKFFHQRASQRSRKNHISGITSHSGEWCTSEDQIAETAIHYFQDLFTSSNPTNFDGVLNSMDHLVTPEMSGTLLQRYNPEEVKQALFQMHPSKAPGPDGMSPFFFQKFWHIVGQDVTKAVLSVLNSGHMLHKMNYTHIVLIPKNNDLKHISDYRPISLGNVISRIVLKSWLTA